MATGITARDKKLLYMLGIIVIASLFFIIGIRPMNRKIKKLDEEVESAQLQHDSIKMKLYQVDMIKEFSQNAEKLSSELSRRYLPTQPSAEIDRMITGKALGYGLKVNNLAIRLNPSPVVMNPYVNSEAWKKRQWVLEAMQYSESLEEDGEPSASEGMIDIDALASINQDDGMYQAADTSQAGVYMASMMLDVYGAYDKDQALLDELMKHSSMRVTSYRWENTTSLPFEYVDGKLVETQAQGGRRLVINFDLYMFDASTFETQEETTEESVPEDGTQTEQEE